MIISEYVEVCITKGNLGYYRKLGYVINEFDKLRISIDNLSKSSHQCIDTKCDFCNKEVSISYKLYNRSIEKGGKFSCSHKCASLKRSEMLFTEHGVTNLSHLDSVNDNRKKTNLERYGVEHYTKTDSFKQKSKSTNLERYGVDNYTKTSEYIDRVRLTNLERYGVEWALQSEDVKSKSKSTNLEKYGFEQPSKSKRIKDKIVETNLERYGYNSPMSNIDIQNKSKDTLENNYGVNNPMRSEVVRSRGRKTNLERRGVEYPTQSRNVIDKQILNNVDKYGVEHLTHSEDFRKLHYKISNHKDYLRYKDKGISIFNCKLGHEFEIMIDNYIRRTEQGIGLCTICNPIGDQKSIKEKDLLQFISNIYKGEVISSYRDGLEIDIYLPDLKIGFEFNGLYYHSEKFKDKNYHLDKTKYFNSKGIRIIHIWEDDWDLRKDIIKSQVSNWISGSVKIYARKCEVIEIFDVNIARNFLDNHIQGYVRSQKRYGLVNNGELVSIMTFDNLEGRNKMEEGDWNLNRFCNKIGYNIVGGASRLLKHFVNTNNPKRIISYADRDWSEGDLYITLGFIKIDESRPDYKYIVGNKRVNKSRFRKSKLNTKLSESKYMESIGINRIWDCGKIKFEKKYLI